MYFYCHPDALGGSPKLKQDSCHTVKLIMSEFDLIDLWRVKNPTLRQFTWRISHPRKMRRLDYLLIPIDLQFKVKSCEILAPLQSDHSPVFLNFKSFVDGGTKGPGHWKFNNSLLNDATLIDEMQELIDKVSRISMNLMTQGLILNFSSTKLGTLLENTQ